MTKHTHIIAADDSIHADRHDGWTPAKQASFLRKLAASRSVSAAARSVGLSRQSAYALRARLRGEPFDRAWTAALLCRFDALAEAAMDRALNGVEVPHYYKGEMVGTSRKYDERLTVSLLTMRESFYPPVPRDPSDPAAAYEADEFGPLVDRVAHGPATWREEQFLAYDDAPDDFADDDATEGGEKDEERN